ncbi:DUF1003 domain-containing protein [Phaeovulum sp.]|uniref:DUF1003 domain-containing protein n=1 Tax=Phaeovulum sp. TaxID=2934796 RepID=UPI0035619818
MDEKLRALAEHLLKKGYDELSERDQRVLRRIAARSAISRDLSLRAERAPSFGARVADRVAAFGGSWTFILTFGAVVAGWVALNALMLTRAVDPYPFVFLNLLLSMVAAFQAPVIMMSQNRQSEKDRLAAAHDYEVNLKAELEIMSLHEKFDELRMHHLERMFGETSARLAAIEALLQPKVEGTASTPR